MDRLLRSLWRLAKVAAVVAAVVAGLVWVSKRRAREEPQVAPPVWPPLPVDEPAAATTVVVGEALVEEADGTLAEVVVAEEVTESGEVLAGELVVAVEELPGEAAGSALEEPDSAVGTGNEAAMWVLPKDGACPEGYPVKAKVASRIYHVPGGTSYARTTPDRCYATPADAESGGFRPAKR